VRCWLPGNDGEKNPVVMVLGTRPEAIKMAPLALELKRVLGPGGFKLITSSQHGRMSSEVLDHFGIEPDFALDVRSDGQTLSELLSKVVRGTGEKLRLLTPSLVLVHGDTTTALGGALAAFYEGFLVGHVEAGLRTYNLSSPFPEELNRQVIAKIATIHFAPTPQAGETLIKEGVEPESVFVTGNTVIDALRMTLEHLGDSPRRDRSELLGEELGFDPRSRRFVLVTLHRRENLHSGIGEAFRSIRDLCRANPEIFFVLPLHPNPLIGSLARDILGVVPNARVLGPLDYADFVFMLGSCFFVLTDSGGIQEEAAYLKKPVLVMRDTTERQEGIRAGTAVLVGTDTRKIVAGAQELISSPEKYSSMAGADNPYGDGYACERVLAQVLRLISREV